MSRQTKANQKLREAGGKTILFKASPALVDAMNDIKAWHEFEFSQQGIIEAAILKMHRDLPRGEK